MISPRRSLDYSEGFEKKTSVDLLERKVQESYDEFTGSTVENLDEERERMQRNLEKLLNYDRFTEENMGSTLVEEREEVSEEIQTGISCSDEDTRPSSTTMQFADGEIEQVYSDMRRGAQEQKNSYRLNTKGKVVVFLYSLAVAVILALIVLNTGVLTMLRGNNMETAKILDEKIGIYQSLETEIASVSSDATVTEIATGEFGMIEG